MKVFSIKSLRILGLALLLAAVAGTAPAVSAQAPAHDEWDAPVGDASQAPIHEVAPDGTIVVHTATLTDAEGFNGPTPLDISIVDGRIEKIETLPNDETPSFFRRAVAVVIPQYEGIDVAEAAVADVDGASGATYSSDALISNVRAGAQYALDNGLASAPKPSSTKILWACVAAAVLLLCLFAYRKKMNNEK